MSPPQITSPLEQDYSQREIAANCPCAVTLSSALTANLSFYSNESALSPALPETLAPSFGTGKLQHFNIPFVPSKSRLDVWVSNCEFCPEIGSIDNLATCTVILLVFATMKTVSVLVVHLLATGATHRFGSILLKKAGRPTDASKSQKRWRGEGPQIVFRRIRVQSNALSAPLVTGKTA